MDRRSRAQSTRINGKVAHYTGQAELHQLIQDGLSARVEGDLGVATARLARARQLAGDSGRTETAKLLDKVVEVDPARGPHGCGRTSTRPTRSRWTPDRFGPSG